MKTEKIALPLFVTLLTITGYSQCPGNSLLPVNDTTLCYGNSLTLTASSFNNYVWSTGATTPSITVAEPGIFSVCGSTTGTTLIVNGDFEQGNSGFSTQYTIGNNGPWGALSNAGTYRITTTPSLVHSNFVNCPDHTPNPGNKQMVINGSGNPNTKVWCQVVQTEPNTLYEFGTWTTSVVNGMVAAQLQFSINNIQIGSIFSPSQACSWIQFTENWYSGLTTSAEICIVNQNTIEGGNDFALDDITFSPVCTDCDTIEVLFSNYLLQSPLADQTICSGDTATLTAQPNATTYTWNNGAETSEIQVSESGNYWVTLTNTYGCIAYDTVQVTVLPAPLALAGQDQTVCSGDTITLEVSGNIQNCSWTNGITDGVPFTPVTTLIYTVTGITDNNCFFTDSVLVTVIPNPVLDAGDDQNVCAGNPIVLSASGGTNYTWNNNVINNVPFYPAQSGSYIVTGVTTNNCVNSDTVLIAILPLPNVTAGQDLELCQGVAITLSGSGGVSYSWSGGVTDNQAFYPTPGTTLYVVQGTDTNNCSGFDSVQVVTYPLPVVSGGNDQIICPGNAVILTGSGATSYEWNNGLQNGIPFYPTETAIYTVTGTSMNGCSDTDEIQITVEELPDIFIAATDTVGCIPFTTSLYAMPGNSNLSYSWEFGDGSVASGSDSVFHVYPYPGCFDISLNIVSVSGCSLSITTPNLICAVPAPVASFITSETEISLSGTPVSFLNTSSGASGYSWNFGDGSSPDNTVNPTHIFNETQQYTVQLIAFSQDGCSDTMIRMISPQTTVTYYVPNTFTPDSDAFNSVFRPILSEGFDPYNYQLVIFDRWGEIIFESFDILTGWNGTYQNQPAANGTYIWTMNCKTLHNNEWIKITGHLNLLR